MSKTGKNISVYLVFLGSAILYFFPLLSAKDIFIERDLSVFFIPPKYLWVHLVKTFQFPFWNPHSYAGIPLFAALQPGVLYPPNIFYLILPFNVVWNWLIILHFVFAGITLYLFLRYLKASYLAAFVGGITFMLSGYLISVHNLLNHLFSVVWSPLVLLFFLRYFETKMTKYLVLSSVYLTMQFLAGAPEIVMITGFVMCVIIFFLKDFIDNEVPWSDRFRAFFLILLIFVLVSSVQLIPFCELHFNSVRKGGLPYNEAITWSFAWRDFIQFFIPDFFGYFSNVRSYWLNQTWLKTLYLGIIPFFLSILYFVSKDRRKWVFLLLMGVSFFLAMGGNNPLYKYLYQIPPFSSIRYPAKFLYLFFFMIAVTCGLGLDSMIKGVEEKSHKVKALIRIAFYCGFLFAIGWGFITLFRDDMYRFFDIYGIKPDGYNDISKNIHNIRRFLFFSFLLCTGLLLYLRVRKKAILLLIIISLFGLDLFMAKFGFFKVAPWSFYMGRHEFIGELTKNTDRERYFVTPKTQEAFPEWPADRMSLGAGYAPLFNIFSIDGVEVMRVNHQEHFLNLIKRTPTLEAVKKLFDISGVRYLITSYKMDDKDFRLLKDVPVNEKNSAYLYEYLLYPGRFLLFNKAVYVEDTTAAMEKLTDSTIDLRSTLILIGKGKGLNSPQSPPLDLSSRSGGKGGEGGIESFHKEGAGGLVGTATLVSYGANKVVIECEAKTDAFLYVSDTWYPSWKAYIDGKQAKIYRANVAFRAVEIPAGKHVVTFRYIPLSFYCGLVLTCIGILLCWYLIRRDKGKNRSCEVGRMRSCEE